MKTLRFVLSIAVLIVCATALCSAHPTDGCEPLEYRYEYGQSYGAEYNMPALTFVDQFQPWESLTDTEMRMIAGCDCGERKYRAWANQIASMVMLHYHNTGDTPAVMTEDLLRSMIVRSDGSEPQDFEFWKSPITGEFPRLDAVNFSPGEVYVHYLSEAELQHIASVDSGLSTELGEGNEEWELGARPIYIRVYGHSGVIYEQITNVHVPRK